MNCFNCTVYLKPDRNICETIIRLLNKLDIPSKEQVILWDMANHLSCKKFTDILFVLLSKQENLPVIDNNNLR